jgi:Dockerin type I domain
VQLAEKDVDSMRVLFCLIALMLILQVFIIKPVATADDSSIVGVKPGDFNTYAYNVTLFSNDSSNDFLTFPAYQSLSPIDTLKVSVETVVDTNVTTEFSYTFKDGGVSNVTRWADLATGQVSDGEMANGFLLGLNTTPSNGTVPRTYLGSIVQANHFSGEFQNAKVIWPIDGIEHEWVINYTIDLYVNNSTGTMLERVDTLTNMNGTDFSEMIADIVVIQSNVLLPVGDLNSDGIVDIFDAIQASSAFGSKPGQPNWNSQADLNEDNVIDIFDFIIFAGNFGKRTI